MGGKYDLAYKKLSEIDTLLASLAANADYVLLADTSVNKPKRVLAANFAIQKSAASQVVYNDKVSATISELNAGKTLLADESGITIRPLGVTVAATGSFTSGTAVVVRGNGSSPKIICSFAQGELSDGAILKDGETNITRGAGLSGDLEADKGIVLSGSGATFTGGTSLDIDIQYTKTVT